MKRDPRVAELSRAALELLAAIPPARRPALRDDLRQIPPPAVALLARLDPNDERLDQLAYALRALPVAADCVAVARILADALEHEAGRRFSARPLMKRAVRRYRERRLRVRGRLIAGLKSAISFHEALTVKTAPMGIKPAVSAYAPTYREMLAWIEARDPLLGQGDPMFSASRPRGNPKRDWLPRIHDALRAAGISTKAARSELLHLLGIAERRRAS